MKFRKLAVAAVAVVTVAAACTTGGTGGKGTLKVAVDLPFQGSDKAASDPIKNGVLLAVKEANAAGNLGGYTLKVDPITDNSKDGVFNPQQGATNAQTIVADADVVAMIGPLNSSVAKAQIPITNDAGLLQCSPANTNPTLTKPPDALALRSKHPDKINYIRVATTDDKQGPAAATFAFKKLSKKTALVIDDTTTFGKGIADEFVKQFLKEGGKVVTGASIGAPQTTQDYKSILTQAKTENPDVVYFGGVTSTGGPIIRKQMGDVGMGDLPFIGPDGIQDGSGETSGSFINVAGATAANSYSSLAAIGDFPGKADFNKRYKDEYKIDATGYASTGYACAQVVLDAFKRAIAGNPSGNAAIREALRAAAVDTTHNYDTILGSVHFDANGDTSQLIISFYKADMAALNGKGDWIFAEQVDFAQAQ